MQRWSVSEYDVDGASQIKLHVLLYMPPSQKYFIDKGEDVPLYNFYVEYLCLSLQIFFMYMWPHQAVSAVKRDSKNFETYVVTYMRPTFSVLITKGWSHVCD